MTEAENAPSAPAYDHGTLTLEGAVAIFLGILAILVPNEGGVFMAKLLGLYWLLRGGMDLFRLVVDRAWWVWRLFGALIGLAAGIVMLQHPLLADQIDSQRTVAIIGVLGVLYGMVCLIQAALSRGWGLAVLGLLSGVLGLMLLGEPYMGDVPLGAIVGTFAVIGGLATIVASRRMV